MPSNTHSKVRNNPNKEKAIAYIVDLKQPIEDGIFEASDFQDYVKEKLKVNGKKEHQDVEVSVKDNRVSVSTKVIFSKRHIKYLTKKYLKKQDMRDYLRVIATEKNTYAIKFANIGEGAEDEAIQDLWLSRAASYKDFQDFHILIRIAGLVYLLAIALLTVI